MTAVELIKNLKTLASCGFSVEKKKIMFVSTPLHKRNILMDYRTYNIAALDFINCNLGIPWTLKMDFETMTEYNGFLVEV